MSKKCKTILFSAAALIGLLVIAAVVLVFFVDANAYRSRMEAAASSALGMQVNIDGRLGLALFPGLQITLDSVHVRNKGIDVAFARQARLGIELFPLLHKKVRFRSITLQHPRISIERDRAGTFNFEKPREKSQTTGTILPAKHFTKISLSDATLLYTDQQSGEIFEASACNLDVKQVRLGGGEHPGLMKNISFTAQLACKEARRDDFALSDLKVSAKANKGVIDLKPVTLHHFGAQGSGSIAADFSGAVPLYHVDYSLPQFRVEEFFKTQMPQKFAEGPMDFTLKLSMQGETLREMRQSGAGQIALRGENLTVNGTDLDEVFARFESSQHFNLVDVGAFFFAGPVGLVVTKGYNFANLLQESAGHSRIHKLISEWKVEHGVAQAQDVAMATNKNRMALQGKLDFVNEQFDDVTVALIDAKGCARVKQTIRGSFLKPEVEKPGILKSLAGPVLQLLEKGADLLPGDECEVFYTGSVAPPR